MAIKQKKNVAEIVYNIQKEMLKIDIDFSSNYVIVITGKSMKKAC